MKMKCSAAVVCRGARSRTCCVEDERGAKVTVCEKGGEGRWGLLMAARDERDEWFSHWLIKWLWLTGWKKNYFQMGEGSQWKLSLCFFFSYPFFCLSTLPFQSLSATRTSFFWCRLMTLFVYWQNSFISMCSYVRITRHRNVTRDYCCGTTVECTWKYFFVDKNLQWHEERDF